MKKVTLCLLALLLATGMIIFQITPVRGAEPERYGYTLLENDYQRIAYQAIASGIADPQPQKDHTVLIVIVSALVLLGGVGAGVSYYFIRKKKM